MKNIADMMTKCLSATVRERLMFVLSAIAREIARKHLGGTQVVSPSILGIRIII